MASLILRDITIPQISRLSCRPLFYGHYHEQPGLLPDKAFHRYEKGDGSGNHSSNPFWACRPPFVSELLVFRTLYFPTIHSLLSPVSVVALIAGITLLPLRYPSWCVLTHAESSLIVSASDIVRITIVALWVNGFLCWPATHCWISSRRAPSTAVKATKISPNYNLCTT